MLLHLGLLLHLGPNVITLRTFITLRTSYYTCAVNKGEGVWGGQEPEVVGMFQTVLVESPWLS